MSAKMSEISVHLRFDLLHFFISTVFCLALEGSKHLSQGARSMDCLLSADRCYVNRCTLLISA